jgi:ECF sigma factor
LGRPELIAVTDVTDLLNAIDQGKPQAASQLVPVLYDELRRCAVLWSTGPGLGGPSRKSSPRTSQPCRHIAMKWLYANTIWASCLRAWGSARRRKRPIVRPSPFRENSRMRRPQQEKDTAGCLAAAAEFEALKRTDADGLYSAECNRALCAGVMRADPKALAGEAPLIVKDQMDLAIAWLRKAVAAVTRTVSI